MDILREAMQLRCRTSWGQFRQVWSVKHLHSALVRGVRGDTLDEHEPLTIRRKTRRMFNKGE